MLQSLQRLFLKERWVARGHNWWRLPTGLPDVPSDVYAMGLGYLTKRKVTGGEGAHPFQAQMAKATIAIPTTSRMHQGARQAEKCGSVFTSPIG